jgi:hypothetical protein
MKNEQKCFAICLGNTGYEASLILKKIYEILPDKEAAEGELLRVIDESGEDYLFHESHFLVFGFPGEVVETLCAIKETV